MFAEIEVAEHLLKNKEKISKSASIDELNKLWVNFEEKSDDYVKAAKQMQECNKKHSLFVLRKTPAIHKYYTLEKVLGNPGQYGICKEAICIDEKSMDYQKQFAVKIINKHKYNDPKLRCQLFSDLRAETQLLAAAHEHPNIITYHQVFEDVQHLYIVMDYCGGGELFDTISCDQKLCEQTIANLFRQMMSSLYYIHSLGIAHCDLKPENFIFATKNPDSKILLIDFGMAKIVEWRKYHKCMHGTPYYIAPEVLQGKYNESCDLWSMGIILFVMVFGFPPFHCSNSKLSESQSDKATFKKIQKGFTAKVRDGFGAWFPSAIRVSDECRDLIARLLRSNVADRLTAEEALEHSFLKLNNDKINSHPIKKTINSSMLNSLRGFARNDANKCGLQTQILALLQKCKYLNSTQEKCVKEFFDATDKNGDGRITEKELYDVLKECDAEITSYDVHSMLNAIDADNDGFMDFEELLSSRIARKLQSNEDRLRKVFCFLDFDKSGKISSNELKSALDSMNLETENNKKLTNDQCKELIQECDKNGDGEIDFEEFIQLFRKL